MKKSTDDLLKSLKSKRTIEEYFDENAAELEFDTLPEMIEFNMKQKRLQRNEVVNRSMLGSYAYNIINGTRTNPDRDKLIMLCFGLYLTVEEANRLLKLSGNGELYSRNKRDAIFILALNLKQSVIDANNKLDEYDLPLLPLP